MDQQFVSISCCCFYASRCIPKCALGWTKLLESAQACCTCLCQPRTLWVAVRTCTKQANLQITAGKLHPLAEFGQYRGFVGSWKAGGGEGSRMGLREGGPVDTEAWGAGGVRIWPFGCIPTPQVVRLHSRSFWAVQTCTCYLVWKTSPLRA